MRGLKPIVKMRQCLNWETCLSKEVYSDPSLYRASPIAASLFRGIFHNAFFTVNSDWLRGLTVVWKFITKKIMFCNTVL